MGKRSRTLGLMRKAERVASRAIINSALAHRSLTDTWHYLKEINTPEKRPGDPAWAKDQEDESDAERISNLCAYAIYSPTPSLSTISYLQALNAAGFRSLAINNTRTSEGLPARLKALSWRIYNR
jgi:hypothetical protein